MARHAEIIIEWPKGSRIRWEWDGDRFLRREESAPAPVNYGFVPGTFNPADKSELDAVLLGFPRPAGKRVRATVVGILTLSDGDHKLILSPEGAHPNSQEARALLSWFPSERSPQLRSARLAETILLSMLSAEGGKDGDCKR